MSTDSLPFYGQVRWFNDTFGYGFIRHGDGRDVFVHHSVISSPEAKRQTLRKKEWVSFNIETTSQGLKATKVRKTTPALKKIS